MYAGMYSTASALEAIQRNHDLVASNLANVNTPGYRAQVASFQSLVADHPGIGGNYRHGTDLSESTYDFSMGTIESTGRELDVAIEGEGFFELETDRGPAFTRHGVFFLGEGGAIVAANGMPVMGELGPLEVPPDITPDQVRINQDGTVYAAEAEVGKLKVVTFENPQQLKSIGTVHFEANGATQKESTAMLRQGMRERSNVNATQQLVKLITGMRHHEAAQKALKSMSDTIAQRLRPN